MTTIILVLLLYDYFLTLPLELRYIWHGKLNTIKILFIINRYASLVYQYSIILLSFVQPITNAVRLIHLLVTILSLFVMF